MPRRFFAPDLAPGRPARLPPDEARHVATVLRHRVGDYVTAFDGRGAEYLARVEQIARDQVTVRVAARTQPTPEPRVHFILAHAIVKGNAMDDIVRDATMVGAAVIQPLITAYVNAPRESMRDGSAHRRWMRVAIASAKQSGRAVVPDIAPVTDLESWLRTVKAATKLILVEPRSSATESLQRLRKAPTPASAALLIGAEGGWAAEEISTAVESGFLPITLGRRILRADAVPVAAVSVLQFIWKDW